MRRLWWVLLVGACNTPDDLPVLSGEITGEVRLAGPVADAVVRLHASTPDGALLGQVEETRTDAEGRFAFVGLREAGDFAVRVDVGGVTLLAPVSDFQPLSPEASLRDASISVSAWTTLLMAVADARRQAGVAVPLRSARTAFRGWLQFDPVTTPFGAPGGTLDESVEHTLLTDGFEALAARMADAAGVSTIDAGALLAALSEDAAGDPPGVFDGQGPDGTVELVGVSAVALSGATLQTELLAAVDGVVAEDWGLTLADIRSLRERLACSGVDLFPRCATPTTLDETAPELVDIKPPPLGDPAAGDPLSGDVEVRVRFADPEGQVVETRLERLVRADGGVAERYTADGEVFVVDTTTVVGNGTLYLQVSARNDSGLWSPEFRFAYAVRNLGEGVVAGQVVKGPAAHVEVVARGTRDGSVVELARATSDAEGRYGLSLVEYQGDLRLVARAGEGLAEYVDEARGQLVRWPQDRELAALVWGYDPRGAQTERTISPLTDLALALAEAWAARGDGGVSALYDEALEKLASHFGIQSVERVRSGRPAPFGELRARGIEDAERFMLALSCLAQQAAELGAEVFPEAAETFSALDLVALYRLDAVDGRIDGRVSGSVAALMVEGRAVELPADPLRGALAAACVRWLTGPQNLSGIAPADVTHLLTSMAERDEPTLFGAGVGRFDGEAPAISVVVEPADETGRVFGAELGPESVVAGRVRLVVTAEDETGVDGLEVVLRDGVGAGLEVEVERETHRWRWAAELDTAALAGDFDAAPVMVAVRAVDLLGHAVEEERPMAVDLTPPEVEVTAELPAVGAEWHTNVRDEAVELVVVARDARPVEAWVEFAGERFDGVGVVSVRPGRRGEGAYALRACATDVLGREVCVERTVVVDWTPPTVEVLGSAYLDERPARAAVGDEPYLVFVEPALGLVPTEVVWAPEDAVWPLYKTQVTLGAEDRNLPRLRWAVGDDRSPVERVVVELDGVALAGAGERSVDVDAGLLGVDVLAPPVAGTVWQGALVVRDVAGNEARLGTPEIALYVVAPPPLLEVVGAGPGTVDVNSLRLETEEMDRVVAGGRVSLMRIQVHNPWPVAIAVRPGEEAPEVTIEVGTSDGPNLVNELLPTTSPAHDRLEIPECMYRRQLGRQLPDPTKGLQAEARLTDRVLHVEPVAGATCGPLPAHPATPAAVVDGGFLGSRWTILGTGQDTHIELSVVLPVGQPPTQLLEATQSGRSPAFLDPFRILLFNEPGLACLAESDLWRCQRGWWLTRRVRHLDYVQLGSAEWRLQWAPAMERGGRCEECLANGFVVPPAETRVAR